MQRIKAAGVVSALPQMQENSYEPGFFSNGNPASGEQATMLTAEWCNSVQEELCAVIQEAGIELDQKKTDQLKTALGRLFGKEMQGASATMDGASGFVPKPLAGQERTVLVGEGKWKTFTSWSGVINVLDFGARGNGTADDTTAIQMATQEAIAHNAGVFFPAGRYIASSVYDLSLLCGEGTLVLEGKETPLPSLLRLKNDVDALSASDVSQQKQIDELGENKADRAELTAPFTFKGMTTYANLPKTAAVNDTYYVSDRYYNMSWNGEEWIQSSANMLDLSSAFENCLQGYPERISAENMGELCSGDINNLTVNRIYAVQNGTGILHTPLENVGGLYIPLGRTTSPVGATSAIFITFTQQFFMRLYADEQWQPWKRLVDEIEFSYAVAGYGDIITADNMIEVCNGDAQKLEPERIYVIAAGTGMLNLPEDTGGTLIMYNRGPFLSTGATALFVTLTGTMYYMNRPNLSGVWSAWHRVVDEKFLAPYVHGETVIAESNAEQVCGNNLDNLASNTIYTVSSRNAKLAGVPVSGDGGSIAVLLRNELNASGSMRIFNSFDNEFSHAVRVGEVWGKWQRCLSHDIPRVLAVGDSICYGYRNAQKGFVGDLHLEALNLGVSGARLSATSSTLQPIYAQLDQVGPFTPDIIIFDGGINDYNNDVSLGTVPSSPIDTEDTGTLLGGMQHLLYLMRQHFPFCQLYFVAVHKMQIAGRGYCPVSRNGAGYTQTEMTAAQKALCSVFGVTVVDVFNESLLDTSFPAYLGEVGSNAWCDDDGVHPLEQGYLNAYVPLIRKALITATRKTSGVVSLV